MPYSPYDLSNHKLVKWADIVNLHWVAGFLHYPTFFRKVKKPIVWTLHDRNPFSGGFHFKCYEQPEYSQVDSKLVLEKSFFLKERYSLSIVSPSKWLLSESVRSTVFSSLPHFHIGYGINTTQFQWKNKLESRKELDLPLNKNLILFVADSIKDIRKGFIYAKEAANFLDVSRSTLVTVGKGSFKGNSNLQTISLGFVRSRKQLAQLYSATDVFVVPSIEDNLPNTILECLSCGTPVVAFNIGGVPDMIKHKFNGYLVDEVSSEGLGKGINFVLNNLSLFDSYEISQDCRQRFNIQLQASKYTKLYEKINE